MHRINSLIYGLTPKEIENVCKQTIIWCAHKFGKNPRRKKRMSLSIKWAHPDGDAAGAYLADLNRIYVYLHLNRNIRDLISTTIHEYIHSLQPIPTHYERLLKKHKYYSQHPFERQSRYYEKKYARHCWGEIKKLL